MKRKMEREAYPNKTSKVVTQELVAAPPIQLIVGLGNPGPEYEQTRHNAGFWFLEAMAHHLCGSFRYEKKFHGDICRVEIGGILLRLFKPQTFMNRSGEAIATLAGFFRITPSIILVAHDELDLAPGTVRLKRGGGHGGHNGLRNIASHIDGNAILRLRIGIGHPGHRQLVNNHVLSKPTSDERGMIDHAIDMALAEIDTIVHGDVQRAMNRLHSSC